ncbi:MAG: AI-2E family transporter [Sphingobacteriaceae bacterium]|nr:MAG: AI-2E family transporter [Sphingobacteriaceae bacterium]
MLKNQSPPLVKISLIIFVIIGATVILHFGKWLLVPLAFALVLSMLLVPLSKKLEKRGVPRSLATALCILTLMLTFAIIIGLLAWQLSNVMDDVNQIKQRLSAVTDQVQRAVTDYTGIPKPQQEEIIKNAGPGNILAQAPPILLGITLDIILILVYIFLMMCFRSHLMKFLMKAVPADQQEKTTAIVYEASEVSQKYLTGTALMIISLWVMYGIGFSIVGVRYALFFAVLCGTLEMIPFIGNLTGTLLTVLMGLVQGGDLQLIAGILIVYGLVQFIQSYILQPLVVGSEVNLNPFFTILSIVIGEAIWGVSGMILAIPVFGMMKIVFDRFQPLKPYGFLLGGLESKKSSGIMDKIKGCFK